MRSLASASDAGSLVVEVTAMMLFVLIRGLQVDKVLQAAPHPPIRPEKCPLRLIR